MLRFETRGKHGPTLHDMRIDVSGKNIRSTWNHECARLIAIDYVKKPMALSTNLDLVENTILVHFAALCRQYSKLRIKENPDDPNTAMLRRKTRRTDDMNTKQVARKQVRILLCNTYLILT